MSGRVVHSLRFVPISLLFVSVSLARLAMVPVSLRSKDRLVIPQARKGLHCSVRHLGIDGGRTPCLSTLFLDPLVCR